MAARVRMQEYIESENARLEREQQFWSKEIVVKIEYKYCPNLTIIDTPGARCRLLIALILAGHTTHLSACDCHMKCRPQGPAGRMPSTPAGKQLTCVKKQRLGHDARLMPTRAGLISAAPGRRNSGQQASARQVEQMVRAKMEQREYIILCLEDSNDWSNATSRRMVMQVGCSRHPALPLWEGR